MDWPSTNKERERVYKELENEKGNIRELKFENHTLFPDAINGNDYDSSTKDLMFRLDFDYPKLHK